MKLFKRIAGSVALIGMTTACGHYNIDEAVTKVGNEDGAPTELQQDDQLLALSLPMAAKNPQGVIVVERSGFAESYSIVRSNPPLPALKCSLLAASHLIKVEGSGERLKDGSESTSFTATVTYPTGLKFPLSKTSCGEGQRIIVREGSGFKGLAITKNKAGTKFDLLGSTTPVPLGAPIVCSAIYPNTKCVPEPIYTPSCSIYAARQNFRISDDGQQLKGTVVAASVIQNANAILGECGIESELKLKGSAISNALRAAIPVGVGNPKLEVCDGYLPGGTKGVAAPKPANDPEPLQL